MPRPPRHKRTVGIPDHLWLGARAEADRLGLSISAYVSQLIARDLAPERAPDPLGWVR